MNSTEEKEAKAGLRNFNFVKSADEKLSRMSAQTGRTMTVIIEDLILGRRQFSPEIEEFIENECRRTRRPREQVIEACVYSAMREFQESSALNDKPASVDEIANQLAKKAISEKPEPILRYKKRRK